MSEDALKGPRRVLETLQGEPVVVGVYDTNGVAETVAEHLEEAGLNPAVVSERDLRSTPSLGRFAPDSFVVLTVRSEELAAARALQDIYVEELPDAFQAPEVEEWVEAARQKAEGQSATWHRSTAVLLAIFAIGCVVVGLLGILAEHT